MRALLALRTLFYFPSPCGRVLLRPQGLGVSVDHLFVSLRFFDTET